MNAAARSTHAPIILACDPAHATRADFAACAQILACRHGAAPVQVWVPEGAPRGALEAVFGFYGLAVGFEALVAPDGYRKDAPAYRLAGFALAVLHRARAEGAPIYAAAPGAPGIFALEAGLEVTPVIAAGGLIAQLEAAPFPETAGDLLALELEARAARLSRGVLAADPLLAARYARLTGAEAQCPFTDEAGWEPAAGRILIAPAGGVGDARLAAESLARASRGGAVEGVIADTPLADPGQVRAVARACREAGVPVAVEPFTSAQALTTRLRADTRTVLSLRDVRALDPAGALALQAGAPVIAAVGAQLTEPDSAPACVRPAVSHREKLAALIRDPAARTRWPRPAPAAAAPGGAHTPKIERISVIIATHDRPDMLAEALASLRAAAPAPDEVIVIDDGSPPDAAARNEALCTDFKAAPIRYARTENLYPGHARNTGAALASGDWLYFLDDDNRLRPGALGVVRTVQARRACAAVFSFMEGFGDRAQAGVIAFFGPVGVSGVFDNHVADTGFAVARTAFEQAGGFPETFGVGKEDYAFLLRLMRSGAHWALVPEPLYDYRIHRDRIRSRHRARTARAYGPLASVLSASDAQGRLKPGGLLERLAFMQAEQLGLRHVPERPGARLPAFGVAMHHGLRPALRRIGWLRRLALGDGPVARLAAAVFFRKSRR